MAATSSAISGSHQDAGEATLATADSLHALLRERAANASRGRTSALVASQLRALAAVPATSPASPPRAREWNTDTKTPRLFDPALVRVRVTGPRAGVSSAAVASPPRRLPAAAASNDRPHPLLALVDAVVGEERGKTFGGTAELPSSSSVEQPRRPFVVDGRIRKGAAQWTTLLPSATRARLRQQAAERARRFGHVHSAYAQRRPQQTLKLQQSRQPSRLHVGDSGVGSGMEPPHFHLHNQPLQPTHPPPLPTVEYYSMGGSGGGSGATSAGEAAHVAGEDEGEEEEEDDTDWAEHTVYRGPSTPQLASIRRPFSASALASSSFVLQPLSAPSARWPATVASGVNRSDDGRGGDFSGAGGRHEFPSSSSPRPHSALDDTTATAVDLRRVASRLEALAHDDDSALEHTGGYPPRGSRDTAWLLYRQSLALKRGSSGGSDPAILSYLAAGASAGGAEADGGEGRVRPHAAPRPPPRLQLSTQAADEFRQFVGEFAAHAAARDATLLDLGVHPVRLMEDVAGAVVAALVDEVADELGAALDEVADALAASL